MRRIWFKKEMKDVILAGKKTATTRDHRLPHGQYQAVSGSRFNAKVFAIIEIFWSITSNVDWIAAAHHEAEGFPSSISYKDYIKPLGYDKLPYVYYHEFKVVKILAK